MEILKLGEFKRGDTLSFTATLIDDITELPVSGLASSLKCQGRYENGLLAVEMLVGESANAGDYIFTCYDTTELKSDKDLYFDIQYCPNPNEANPFITSSDTFILTVLEDETK
jgi:hypothetical protein